MTDELIKALEEIIAMQPGGQSLTQVRYIAREALAAHRSQQEAAQEPVAVVESIGGPKSLPQLLWYVGFPRIGVMVKPGDKLYTAPSESEARKPMTEAQIQKIGLELPASPTPGYLLRFARAVEIAHGITDAALSASGQKGEPT